MASLDARIVTDKSLVFLRARCLLPLAADQMDDAGEVGAALAPGVVQAVELGGRGAHAAWSRRRRTPLPARA